MTLPSCEEMQLLIQADLDGELPSPDAARLSLHLQQCPACTRTQRDIADLSRRLRDAAPRHAAPDLLRARLSRTRTANAVPIWRGWAGRAVSFGAGAALAACLMLALLPRSEDTLPDAVIAAHIRALQPGHLMDVLSTDRHTVKPWFDGRLPFAPPVKDLAAAGFPLSGGRLDYLQGHTAASLIYRAGPHVINLFLWPDAAPGERRSGARDGYNFIRWTANGMTCWAVSDLNPAELASFVRIWARAPAG